MLPAIKWPELPERLDFAGEFGAELNSFVPFIYWLSRAGLMAGRRIGTYQGMRPYYFFLTDEQIEGIAQTRRYVPPALRPAWLPTRNDHFSSPSPFEMFPDYRARFRDGLFDVGRPLLIVHNKVTSEWGRPPVNVISLQLLERIFEAMAPAFHVVYLRPGLFSTPQGYSNDHQQNLPFDDLALLRRHPEVELFDEMAASLGDSMSYNEVKLRLYAHADFHITVQGGNAHLLSMFSGGMVAILHKEGHEIRHSYARGHFSYAATPPPRWLICRNDDALLRALPLFAAAQLVDGQVVAPSRYIDLFRELSPAIQCALAHRAPVPC